MAFTKRSSLVAESLQHRSQNRQHRLERLAIRMPAVHRVAIDALRHLYVARRADEALAARVFRVALHRFGILDAEEMGKARDMFVETLDDRLVAPLQHARREHLGIREPLLEDLYVAVRQPRQGRTQGRER